MPQIMPRFIGAIFLIALPSTYSFLKPWPILPGGTRLFSQTESSTIVSTTTSPDPNSIPVVTAAMLKYIRDHRHEFEGNDVFGGCKDEELGIAWEHGGSTNYCFRVHNNKGGAVFVKHAKDFVRGFEEAARLSRKRVWYEYEGSRYLDTCKQWKRFRGFL